MITPNKEGPFPLIIFLHGSGPESRDTSRFAAETFAELGIASAIFDKRGVKESDGSFANATFTDLVSDAITIAEHFSKQSNISDIGFFGHSQGGWIAPLAASQWEKSRFVITSAGPAVSPATEAEWEFVYEVKQSHPEKASLVREIVKAWHQGVRTDDFDGYISMRNTYQTESWYQAAGLNQLDVDNHSSFIKNYRRVMDFQPLPVIQQLDVPMLAMFGDNDESIDSVESFNILNQITNARPNIEVKMYSGYGHSLRQSNPGEPELRFPKLPVNYFRNQAEFILRFTATSQTLNIN